MTNYSVTSCTYNGTGGEFGPPNPLCFVSGVVNGKAVYANVFFAYLAAANAAGKMQQALTAILWNWYVAVYGYTLSPWPAPIPFPTFPPSDAVAPSASGPEPVPPVSYAPALISSWSA